MNKKVVKGIAIILSLAMIITMFSFVFFLPAAFGATETPNVNRTDAEKEDLLVQRLNVLYDYIAYMDEHYKDKIDINDLINGAFNGATEALGDHYSEYYAERAKLADFLNYVDGETFGGVGVAITVNEAGHPCIDSLLQGPAKDAGLKPGDEFVSVNGINVYNGTSSDVSSKLRGEAGTAVQVVVKREGLNLTFTLIRSNISPVSVKYNTYKEYPGLAYIEISSFDADTGEEFCSILDECEKKGAKKLIIDVRGNGGGYIAEATEVADRLVEGGYIYHSENQGKIIDSIKADDGRRWNGNIILLVDEDSASASELLAGALQDRGYKLVGNTTFGKGYSQIVKMLGDGTSFKLSTEYFLTPNKRNFAGVGLTPDYVVRNSSIDHATYENRLEEYNGLLAFDGTTKNKAGDYHINVYAAQQRLKLLGYSVTLNGRMDQDTVNAIKKLQKEEGLYSYGGLDLTTQSRLDLATAKYVTGIEGEDYQLEKALELLGY